MQTNKIEITQKPNISTSISNFKTECDNITNEHFNEEDFEREYKYIIKYKIEEERINEITNNSLFQNDCFNFPVKENESGDVKYNLNHSFNYKRKLFKVSKKGRNPKGKDNADAKHKKNAKDNCYKKIINLCKKNLVDELNSKLTLKMMRKLRKITEIEKGYSISLLNKTNYQILTDYKIFRNNNENNNHEILKQIMNINEINSILEMKFNCYIDKTMKEKLKQLNDEKEKKQCEEILKNGILNFCRSIKRRPNRGKKK